MHLSSPKRVIFIIFLTQGSLAYGSLFWFHGFHHYLYTDDSEISFSLFDHRLRATATFPTTCWIFSTRCDWYCKLSKMKQISLPKTCISFSVLHLWGFFPALINSFECLEVLLWLLNKSQVTSCDPMRRLPMLTQTSHCSSRFQSPQGRANLCALAHSLLLNGGVSGSKFRERLYFTEVPNARFHASTLFPGSVSLAVKSV